MNDRKKICAFITGAAGGIAEAVLEKLSQHYSGTLGLADLNQQRLSKIRAKYERDNLIIKTFAFDITNTQSLKEAIKETAAENGLDLLLNNAGVMTNTGSFEEATEEQISLSLNVNYSAVAQASLAAWPYLETNKGCVINNASGAGLTPFPHDAVYGASKAAVIMLTKSLALRHDASGIRFNAICPGVVDTPILINPETGTYFEATQAYMKAFHLISPNEIALAILSQFEDPDINGQIRSITNTPRAKT